MRSLARVFLGVVVIGSWIWGAELRAQGPRLASGLKENLDLPYDAFASSEEEEDAPELVAFYGQVFEGDCFIFVGQPAC